MRRYTDPRHREVRNVPQPGEPQPGIAKSSPEALLRAYWAEIAARRTPWPSEPELATQLGISRPALREALVRLEVEGLIRRRRGDATYVNAPASRIVTRFDQQARFDMALSDAGLDASTEHILAETVIVTDDQAATLEVANGSPALRVVKRWRANGVIVMVAKDLIPLVRSDGRALELPEPLVTPVRLFPFIHALRNEPIEWEIARPSAATPTSEERAWFDDDELDAMLTLDLTGVSRQGNVLYQNRELHRPGAVPFGFVRSIRH